MKKTPKKVIVIRHAEKPIRESNQGLSSLGIHRAEKWKDYIPQNFGTPELIYATAPTRHSIRPLQTIMPLYESLEAVELVATVDDTGSFDVGRHLADGNIGAGQIVLVCWHHGRIPEFMRGIRAKHHEFPDPWPEDDYGTALVITFEGGEPTVTKFKM